MLLAAPCAAALLGILLPLARADLDYTRTHIVDVFHPMHDGPPNLLVRSNMPTNATSFQLDELVAAIAKRAQALGGVQLGFPLYIHDISLNNVFNKVRSRLP
eukprot:SAG22_NODE_1676_length_3830_cov_3.388100_6_plen_102_part_00